jgi:hypothetical protein
VKPHARSGTALSVAMEAFPLVSTCVALLIMSLRVEAAEVAHTEDAILRLDLTAFPLMDGADEPERRTIAILSYKVASDTKTAFLFQRKKLLDLQWTQLPGNDSRDEISSGMFERDGFHVWVSTRRSDTEGRVEVFLKNYGNVEAERLPFPAGAKLIKTNIRSALLKSDVPIAKTCFDCEKALLADGWQPYGSELDSPLFRKNAVILRMEVYPSDEEKSKSSITYSVELMSFEVPMMPGAEEIHYENSKGRLDFHTGRGGAAVAAFYREALAGLGWKVVPSRPTDFQGNPMILFEHPRNGVLGLRTIETSGKLRVEFDHQSVATATAYRRLVRELAEKLQKKHESEDKK